MTPETFIKQFLPVAEKVSDETGIPALAMLTQAALETGWGTKVKRNNYFGIKGNDENRQLIRTREVLASPNKKFPKVYSIKKLASGKFEYDVKAWFTTYPNPIDSFRDYTAFLKRNKRYKKALSKTIAKSFLIEVARAGYASSENYEETVLKVLQSIIKRLQKI